MPPLPFRGRWTRGLGVGDRMGFTDTRRRLAQPGHRSDCGRLPVGGGDQDGLCRPRHSPSAGTRSYRQAILAQVMRRVEVGNCLPRTSPRLKKGDTLILTRELHRRQARIHDAHGRLLAPATIGCTLPEVFALVRPHERIWLDDGKIGGIITAVTADQIHVAITEARDGGAKLGADKGINLPDSDLTLPSLTTKDLDDLPFIAANADLIGYSFVREPSGIADLRSHLEQIGWWSSRVWC